MRESLFSILGDMRDADIVDAFAGTGALGCEALSRGARSCVFYDVRRASLEMVRENVGRVDGGEKSRVLKGSFPQKIASLTDVEPDILFLDPPYGREELVRESFEAMERAACVTRGALVVLEQEIEDALPSTEAFECEDERVYGRTRITMWRAS